MKCEIPISQDWLDSYDDGTQIVIKLYKRHENRNIFMNGPCKLGYIILPPPSISICSKANYSYKFRINCVLMVMVPNE